MELFAGRGTLSRAMIQAGFAVLSVDHENNNAVVPIIALDLTTASGVAILWDILSAPSLMAIHLGLPCGTASLARERPVPAALQAQGAPNPPPLRSAEHPLGKPGLRPFHQAKVDSANKLYALAIEVLVFCALRGIVISFENPTNSWLWAALTLLSAQHSVEAARAYNALEKVVFHACCHGSLRRKSTAWLGTASVYSSLAAVCNNDHEHAPWGVRWSNGGWVFDTASEAAYPILLAQRVAECLVRVATSRGLPLQPTMRLHDLATAAQGKQTKKHQPLIPEYHRVTKAPKGAPLKDGTKVLPPHLGGDVREEDGGKEPSTSTIKLGHFHTPKQFLSMALNTMHPMDTTEHLEAVTQMALDCNLRYPPHLVELERKKNLLQAKLLAVQTKQQEEELHASLPESLQKVLAGKKLIVWQKLLEKFGYDDLAVVKFMTEGVPIVGKHDAPACYPEKVKPASLTREDLESSALWRRKAAFGRGKATLEGDHIEHLEQTAEEEISMGFVEGPFNSEEQVTAYFGHNRWSVVRRFVLVQGTEMKLRPIDDCLEAQVNQGFTSSSYLKLQDVDYIAGLALRVAEAVAGGKQCHGSGRWMGKCLDLSKAYKQVGILPAHRHLSVIFFHDKDGRPKFFVANSLMFGATAAVYAFNRISRSLWFLFNKMLLLPCGVFYDDFPLFSPEGLAVNADQSASALLDLLGWRHARTGLKGRPFEEKFQVLGCSLDLAGVPQGEVTLENKPGRLDRLCEHFQRIKAAGTMTLHEAQILHGLLRYACGFFAGKHLHQVCAEVMSLGSASGRNKMAALANFCDYACDMLAKCVPRTLSAFGERKPVLIFTDGCWEGGRAGIGAVVIDTALGTKQVFAGEVPPQLISAWAHQVGDQLICQIELYAMVVLRWMLRQQLAHRRSIWWVDNEAARFSVIKGMSPSATMKCLARAFYSFEVESPTCSWVERVPSYSNIADGPSRAQPEEAMFLLGVQACCNFDHPNDLLALLLANQLVI